MLQAHRQLACIYFSPSLTASRYYDFLTDRWGVGGWKSTTLLSTAQPSSRRGRIWTQDLWHQVWLSFYHSTIIFIIVECERVEATRSVTGSSPEYEDDFMPIVGTQNSWNEWHFHHSISGSTQPSSWHVKWVITVFWGILKSLDWYFLKNRNWVEV